MPTIDRNRTNNVAWLKSGDYIISDPCYVMSDADYESIIIDNYTNENGYDITNVEHGTFFVCEVGDDGVYGDKHGNDYGVDSGQIGAIPYELCTEEAINDKENYNHVHFDNKVYVGWEDLSGYSADYGLLTIGDYEIETGMDRDDFTCSNGRCDNQGRDLDDDDTCLDCGEEW